MPAAYIQSYPLTVRCSACKSTYRIQVTQPTMTKDTSIIYCLHCGTKSLAVFQDSDLEYWEALSDAFQVDIDMLKMLYDMWVSTPNEFNSFSDFIAKVNKSVPK